MGRARSTGEKVGAMSVYIYIYTHANVREWDVEAMDHRGTAVIGKEPPC